MINPIKLNTFNPHKVLKINKSHIIVLGSDSYKLKGKAYNFRIFEIIKINWNF